jgi:uncharacterized RDD family membrane protein YckC
MTDLALDPATRKRMRVLVTPEGVPLNLELSTVGQRFGALALDMMIVVGTIVLVTIALGIASSRVGGPTQELMEIVWLLGLFLLRNAYFLTFEMSARAATPGKRVMGLRVASRNGGRLTFEAIFARNALRELELFLPLTLLAIGPFMALDGGMGGWIWLLAVIWCAVFVLLPFFNADKLRAGDMVAGTWVLRAPRQKLMRDMADGGAAHRAAFSFTVAQLDAYGVRELQVLEQVLRANERVTVRAVADRIARKVGYDRGQATDLEFLHAYYHAIRERMEARLLMGKRRRDKFDRSA